MLGNQSIEVLQLLSKLLQQSSKSFLLCWYVFVKPLWPKLQTRYSSLQGFQKWSDSDGRHATNKGNMWKVSYKPLKMFGYQTCHVFPQLEHVFFLSCVTVSTLRWKQWYMVQVLRLQEWPSYNILKLTSLFLACLLQVALCSSVLNNVLLVFASVSDL